MYVCAKIKPKYKEGEGIYVLYMYNKCQSNWHGRSRRGNSYISLNQTGFFSGERGVKVFYSKVIYVLRDHASQR